MRMRTFLIGALGCLLAGASLAQTSLNPDISLIGDLRTFSHNDHSREAEAETFNIADPELELVIAGYLNPYIHADATLAWHTGTNAEVEEIYATVLRGLPLNLNLRAGKYRLEFGRLNPVHPHAYSFVHQPLPHAVFFGDEGLNDMAIRASTYIPTGDAFTEAKIGVLKGDALFGHEHGEEGGEEEHDHEGESERNDLGVFGRLTTSFAVSESGELAVGGSVVNAPYAEAHHEEEPVAAVTAEGDAPDQLRATVLGGDIKYKWKPSRYTSLQVETEALMRIDEHPEGEDALKSYGAYGYVDYRFRQRYNVGGIVEWVRQKELHESEDPLVEPEVHQSDLTRFGLFVGFAPVEETSLLRLAGHWTEPDEGDGFWELTLQLVFSLGPHQPHNF